MHIKCSTFYRGFLRSGLAMPPFELGPIYAAQIRVRTCLQAQTQFYRYLPAFFFLCGHKGLPSGENAVGNENAVGFLSIFTLLAIDISYHVPTNRSSMVLNCLW